MITPGGILALVCIPTIVLILMVLSEKLAIMEMKKGKGK
jgi:hypothetical protein